jgi:hypothetical protein
MTSTSAEIDRARRLAEGVNKDAIAVSGLVASFGLATGFLLTWARISSEDIPAQPILGTLPTTYFVTVAIRSMLAPLMVALAIAVLWIVLAVRPTTGRLGGWAVFGAVLGGISAWVANWLNRASFTPDLLLLLVIAAGAAGLSVAVGAAALRRARDAEPRARARTIIAATIALGFVVPCAARIADAFSRAGSLPFTRVVVDTSCRNLAAAEPNPGAASATGDLCPIGGFYLGSTGDDILIVKRRNPCEDGAADRQPELVTVPRAHVQMVVAWDGKETCPPRSDAAAIVG